MTSTTNARELERQRRARTAAQERFAEQMTLLEQIVATAGEREGITRRWNRQPATLAELSRGAASAAELSGLPKADIDAAVKAVDRAEMQAMMEARTRRCAAAGRPGRPAIVWRGRGCFGGVAGGVSELDKRTHPSGVEQPARHRAGDRQARAVATCATRSGCGSARRAALREWTGALERGDIELAVPRAAPPEQQLDLGLHVDYDVDAGYEAGHEVR